MLPLLRTLFINPLISIHKLIMVVAVAFILFYNHSYFHNLGTLYGDAPHGYAFIVALGLLLLALHVLLLCLLCFRYTTKPVLTLLFFGGAAASYYMDRYNIVVDTTMLTNVLQTDSREVKDLMSYGLMAELLVLGLLPSLWLWRTRIHYSRWTRELRNRLLLITLSLGVAVLAALPFTADYASFFREQKLLRYYTNPLTFVYSGVKLAYDTQTVGNPGGARTPIGTQAKRTAQDGRRNLVILVVGEAARADHFSLNGYDRETNPLLAAEDVIFFSHVTSCGTATAYSVPCMFSAFGRGDFSLKQAAATENVLDVLTHAGTAVLWRDNNSDSKGVAKGVEFQDFQHSPPNTVCDEECRDIGMLEGLDEWIGMHPGGDITIVLHQMGNHGPSYYKRYPPEFAHFQPTCLTNQLEKCRQEDIVNSYDNSLLYTDWFLSQTIAFLKQHDEHFSTALLYVADHGESLGENGLYLHGMPFLLAPDAQKHIAALLWFGKGYPIDRAMMKQRAGGEHSHDDYFHTVLGLLQITTPEYDASKDWMAGAHK